MDGTVAPLKGLRDLADKYRALLAVDDSHATGFFGETGRYHLKAVFKVQVTKYSKIGELNSQTMVSKSGGKLSKDYRLYLHGTPNSQTVRQTWADAHTK